MSVKNVYCLLGLIFILGLAACGDESAPADLYSAVENDQPAIPEDTSSASPRQVTNRHLDYVKPGADIRFLNDYDGYSEPGVEESFILSVRALSPVEGLTLNFSASDGMDVLMETEQVFKIGSDSLEIPVKVYAKNPGAYRFRVNGVTNLGFGAAQARSYSLTINVGAQAENTAGLQQKASSDSVITTPEGEALIRRSAEEKIY